MNRNVILSAVFAMSLTMPGLAFAEGNGEQDRGHDEHAQQNERGAGPNHSYHKGDRLPAAEHTKQYEVNDWRGRNMREPPRGYHWVRSGNDYVLAAIATGVIADILLSR
jgi:Ni/Co efflux regulator RcnB